MFSKLSDLPMFIGVIEKAYGSRVAYRYLVDDLIVDKTFAQLAHDVKAIASWIVKEGYSGKHIAIIGSTSYSWISTFLGIVCSANVVVPVDKMLSENEMMNILNMGDVNVVFASEEFEHLLQAIEQDEQQNIRVIRFAGEEYPNILRTELASLPESDPEGLAEILFTSGTTGVSKGVMLSQKNLCANIADYYSLNILDKTRCEPVAMSVLPIHHTE